MLYGAGKALLLIFCIMAAGPILLEDYHLVEKIAQFDRERIPERVVHARGASAKGFFEVTHDISHLTCADFLRSPGVQTPIILRFSTVIHERGSPESLRDPRGFAVKFYTREVDLPVQCRKRVHVRMSGVVKVRWLHRPGPKLMNRSESVCRVILTWSATTFQFSSSGMA